MSKSIPLRAHEAAAYAAGRLTQLRRVCKFDPKIVHASYHDGTFETARIFSRSDYSGRVKSPYGAPGDMLALREGFALVPVSAYRCSEGVAQTANPDATTYEAAIYRAGFDRSRGGIVWRSSTSMPAWAVRWHPVITAVRLERVQDMTEGDAVACGIGFTEDGPLHWHTMIGDWWVNRATHKEAAQDLWNHLNPRTPWKDNPWTWVYEIEGAKA